MILRRFSWVKGGSVFFGPLRSGGGGGGGGGTAMGSSTDISAILASSRSLRSSKFK